MGNVRRPAMHMAVMAMLMARMGKAMARLMGLMVVTMVVNSSYIYGSIYVPLFHADSWKFLKLSCQWLWQKIVPIAVMTEGMPYVYFDDAGSTCHDNPSCYADVREIGRHAHRQDCSSHHQIVIWICF